MRLSGERARDIASCVFSRRLETSHLLLYGSLTVGGRCIDRGLAVWMQQPRSFTGEDVVEFHTHGSSTVAQLVVEACISSGARLARPGEFTLRAFLNGKLDLAQAEAVGQLIASRHERSAQLAAQSLAGHFSQQIDGLRLSLLDWLTLLEAEIDFGDEIESLPAHQGLERCRAALSQIDRLLEGARSGRTCAEGLRTVMLGPPNAGKSTLLNLLLGTDRALVTPIAGTTRDTLEELTVVEGVLLRLVDTAGIRSAPADLVEQLGIERSRAQVEAAQLLIVVLDASQDLSQQPEVGELFELCRGRPTLILLNKIDLGQKLYPQQLPPSTAHFLSVSLQQSGDEVFIQLARMAQQLVGEGEQVFNLTQRQWESLVRCRESLQQVSETLLLGHSAEFVALDLRGAIQILGEIQGIDVTEEVLDRIFSSFCLGK